MNRFAGIRTTLLVSSFTSLPALSSGEAHEVAKTFLGLPFVFWQAANLIIFLSLLVYFLKKPFLNALATRRQEVDDRIRKSEEDARRAEEMVQKLSSRMVELEREVAQLREASAKRSEAEDAETLRQSEEEAKNIAERAGMDIENRIRAARRELTIFAGNLAVDLAREVVRRNLNPEDQKRLFEEGLAALEKKNSSLAGRPN